MSNKPVLSIKQKEKLAILEPRLRLCLKTADLDQAKKLQQTYKAFFVRLVMKLVCYKQKTGFTK
jgi:hypothetical protein